MSTTLKITPGLPVEVAVRFESQQPQIAAYRLWYRNSDDIISTILGTGTDKGLLDADTYP